MLVNLVGNAAKYGDPPIELHCSRSERHVVIAVRDYGPGVPDGFVAHLFDRFTRADTPSVGGTPGTGLGLFIVRQLVAANGGTISYEPASPRGSRFVVQLELGR